MPTHTPSPHRFLAPAPPSSQKPRPKLQSSLRHGFTTQNQAQTCRPTIASQHARTKSGEGQRATPVRRFVVGQFQPRTPRHGERVIGIKNEREGGSDGEAWAHTHTPRPKLPRLGKVESIEESSPSSSANEVGEHGVLESVEQSSSFGTDLSKEERGDDSEEEILFVTEERWKRRRITPQSEPPSSPTSFRHDHRQELHTPAPASHRFKVPAPKAPATFDNNSTITTAPNTHRPHFILPRSSPSPSKSATPLPETFSPSRKNGKYIQGGLASTLQSWIVETAEAGYSARSSGGGGVVWGRDKEDGVKMRVRVKEVHGGRKSDDGAVECWVGGVVFVRGTTDVGLYNASRASNIFPSNGTEEETGGAGGAETRILLAGQGATRGKAGVRIHEGAIIGIRAPMWDVDVGIGVGKQTQKWIVGVEWVVLS